MSLSPTFTRSPPEINIAKISFPAPRVLLVTISRPKALNAIAISGSWELASLFEWFDEEPSLWVSIVTGEGRTFSAGADLKGKSGYCADLTSLLLTMITLKRGMTRSGPAALEKCRPRGSLVSHVELEKSPS